MISKRNIVVFFLPAALLAFLVAGLVSSRLHKPVVEKTRVVVAKAPLLRGQVLTPDKLELIEWPDPSPPDGYFGSVETLTGRIAADSISEKDPILESVLIHTRPESEWGLSEKVPEGYMAFTLAVDEISGLSGSIAPGDLVDVIATNPLPNDRSQRIARLLLQGARVYSVSGHRDGRIRAVTLILRPSEANILSASAGATLRLVARSRETDTTQSSDDVVFSSGVGAQTPEDLDFLEKERDRIYRESIGEGLRAVTISISGLDGICGFLKQGNRVDVVGVHSFVSTTPYQGTDAPGQKVVIAGEPTYAKIVLQDMEVLAVADDAETSDRVEDVAAKHLDSVKPGANGCEGPDCLDAAGDREKASPAGDGSASKSAKRVTLLADPVQAEQLALLSDSSSSRLTAGNSGIRLIMRNYDDREIVNTRGGSSKETVYGVEEERYRHVTVFRGAARSTRRFPVAE